MMKRTAARTIAATFFAIMSTLALPALAETVRAVEYYHQEFEHYFVTANPAEIAALDSGAVGGWWRTGQRYRVDDASAEGLVPVCRFFTAAYAGKASHFFTASTAECVHVKTMRDWTYEGVAFYARVPDAAGNCAAGTARIYRLFNNGQGDAPNHAYTAWSDTRAILIRRGWIYEGVAFCAPLADLDSVTQLQTFAASNWNLPRRLSVAGRESFLETRYLPPMTYCWDDCRCWEDCPGDPTPYDPFSPSISLEERSHSNTRWRGRTTWDPLAGSFVVRGMYDWVWYFDAPLGPSTPVCSMSMYLFFTAPIPLYSGCEYGLAFQQ